MACKRNQFDDEIEISPKRQQIDQKQDVESKNILKGFYIYIFPTGIGSLRKKVFCNHIKRLGGCVTEKFSDQITHILVDEKVTPNKVLKILGISHFSTRIKLVKTCWLSSCIKENVCLSTSDYEVDISDNFFSDRNISPSSGKSECSQQHPLNETSLHNKNLESHFQSFICAIPSTQSSFNHNKYITDKLEVIAEMYKTTGDHWRTVGYQKAIVSLKNCNKPITTWKEAKSLPGVGERLADKIYEIIQSGHLRKIEETCSEEKVAALNLFHKIWGVGPNIAESFVQQGFRTLNDVLTKAKLTKAQKIGIKYYEELQDRMPREEAYELFCKVAEQAKNIDSHLHCEICGSYRRNRKTCGDIDILITHEDGKSHEGVLNKIVTALHDSEILTDDLVSQEENCGQKKYMGICKLPGEDKKHRRIDIIVVPSSEYACALMHFTGSAYFNRSMRLLAKHKNMSLSEHSLKAGVVRKGQEKVTEGEKLHTPTEESIFGYLGLKYRQPHERDHFALE